LTEHGETETVVACAYNPSTASLEPMSSRPPWATYAICRREEGERERKKKK
jgi:hypothetical protein